MPVFQEVTHDQDCTFFFQLLTPDSAGSATGGDGVHYWPPVLKTEFSVEYAAIGGGDPGEDDYRVFKFYQDVRDYRTLFVLSSRVSPAQGGEICRAGTICTLTLELVQTNYTENTTLMYEVRLGSGRLILFGTSSVYFTIRLTCKGRCRPHPPSPALSSS